MFPLIVLLLVLAFFGGLGFAAQWAWCILVVAVFLRVIGFFVGGAARALGGGRRRRQWYGR
jgi:hypothetical protein